MLAGSHVVAQVDSCGIVIDADDPWLGSVLLTQLLAAMEALFETILGGDNHLGTLARS